MTTGFTNETFQFLKELEANNTKEWFEDNRPRYQEHWVGAGTSFVEAVAPMMEGLEPLHKAAAKINGSLRRINRDVRFSKDKSPYNARLHMVFWTGDHPNRSPAIHIVLHPDNVGYGAGEWGMTPERLATFRQSLLMPAKADALKNAVQAAGQVGCDLDEEDLKRVPKGFEDVEDGALISLLKRKSMVARTLDKGMSVADFTGKSGMQKINEIAENLAPLNKWLCDL